ncbi:MAG: putative chaperone protein HtpG [Verrucomicrobia bacterium]|nr:putative chaperone protein HtpG [Verrucomicrobiota bacterium]
MNRPLFTARTTHGVRIAILGCVLTVGAAAFTVFEYYRSPYWNRVGLAPDQPVLFSHRHHAGELRIDCRFCHSTVESSARAGLPSTQTCLVCHSQLFRDAPLLQPVIRSAEENVPLSWSRVNTLPDHVHFDHSIHVAKGVACASCHGEVSDMALTAKGHALTMRECLDCHRDPEPRRVAHAQVFSRRTTSATVSCAILEPVHARPLTNCSTCHH